MTREPVHLTPRQRERALEELVISLLRNEIAVQIVSLDRIHLHVLAPFPDHNPRKWLGIAKKESSHYCKRANLAPLGGLWATRCQCKPIRSPQHWENADGYIFDHAVHGATVWRRS